MKLRSKTPVRNPVADLPLSDGPERAQTPDLLGDAPPGPRIVGYVRVSTTDQSVELQRQALTAAGAAVIHADEGFSGATTDRPGLQAVLADLRRGDTLAVWRLDRLGRGALDTLQMIRDLEARGVAFRSLTEGFDTATPGGRAMLQIIAAFAEMERETMRERVLAGLAAARQNGQLLGRPPALKAAQRRDALTLLGGGTSRSEVARILGVGRATIGRLMAQAK